MAEEKDKAYMAALRALRNLIDREYQEGGWLPPNLTMIERLGVSSSTYVKATSRLVRESIVRRFHRKGLFVCAERYRPKKIGFVVADGKESPFWGGDEVFGIMRTAVAAGFCTHQIQGATVTKVFRSALTHCVKGLVWLHPSASSLPEFKECVESMAIPMVAVLWQSQIRDFQKQIPFVALDRKAFISAKVSFLVGRGHRKVMYVGRLTDELTADYAAYFAKAGVLFDCSCRINDRSLERGRLAELVLKHKASALIIEGKAGEALERIFQQLSTLPADKQPELLSHWQHSWIGLHRKYPEVKLAGDSFIDGAALGAKAAQILLQHQTDGKPLRSALIDNCHIVSGTELEARLNGSSVKSEE